MAGCHLHLFGTLEERLAGGERKEAWMKGGDSEQEYSSLTTAECNVHDQAKCPLAHTHTRVLTDLFGCLYFQDYCHYIDSFGWTVLELDFTKSRRLVRTGERTDRHARPNLICIQARNAKTLTVTQLPTVTRIMTTFHHGCLFGALWTTGMREKKQKNNLQTMLFQ